MFLVAPTWQVFENPAAQPNITLNQGAGTVSSMEMMQSPFSHNTGTGSSR